LTLERNEEHVLDIVSWCSTAVESRDGLREELAASQRQVQALDKSVEALKKQLDELIAAKRSDEAELLDKFQKLLNEKKRKIRDQERRLAHTRVATDGSEDEGIEKHQEGSPKAKTTIKGAQGQKRKGTSAEQAVSSNSDDGFNKMDVDTTKGPPRRDDQLSDGHDASEQEDTASGTASGTASESDEDEAARATGRHTKGRATSEITAAKRNMGGLPPKREIPNLRGKPPAASTRSKDTSQANAGDSQTQSDDEL
jgi:chromosome segregation ATPase